MRRLVRIIAFVLAGLGLPASAPAEVTLADLDGAWIAEYVDGELGRVTGEARIDAAAGSAEVTYRDPRTGASATLRSTALELQNGSLIIELEGRSPNLRRADGLGAPEIAYKLEKPAPEITVRWGENTASLPVSPLPSTDRDRVTLTLSVSDELLSGNWRYRSHWFLGRAVDGWGRDGEVEIDQDGVAWTAGSESWRRPRPVVYGVLPLEDQLALTMFSDGTSAANFPYPFGKNHGATGKSRHLFVFGKELPRDFRRNLRIEAVDPGIDYVEVARQDEATDPYKSRFFADGWRLLRERLPSAIDADAAVASLDAIVLRANLSADAVPGINSFRVNGQETGWLLQFGDNTAQLRIVRAIGRANERYEPTSYLFPGELVRIEIETAQKLPVDSIPAIIGIDGKPLLLGDGEGIPAGRVADNPRLYRTDYVRLAPGTSAARPTDLRAGNGLATVPVRQASRVFATLGHAGLISVPPAIAQATVFETTGDTAVGGDWLLWLSDAAACAGSTATGVALETGEADTISKLLINSGVSRFPIPGWLETKVTVGQHAAMLVLRDTFVRLLENNRAQFSRIVSDDDILAFRRQMEPLVRQGATPLAKIEVDRLGGGRTEFLWTFETAILAKLHDGRIDEIERWAIDATRQALDHYRQAMAAASQRAREIKACDVEALLRLTGFGFDPVVQVAKSKMMVPVPGLGLWVPDFRARAWIDTVALIGDQVRIHDRIATEDRQAALMAVGLATIPVAIAGGAIGSAAAVVATAVIDVFDIAYGVYGEVDQKWAADAEVEFAKGAADVLGMQRLARAEAERQSWSTVFVRLGYIVGPAAVGLGLDIPDLFKAFREGFKFRKVVRGRAAALAMNGVEPLASGAGRSPEIQRLVSEAIEEARRLGTQAADTRAARQLADALGQSEDAPPLRLRFDELADASDNTVDDIGAYLDDIGESALRADLDELALEAARRAVGEDIATGFETPDWARHFRPGTFEEIRRHVRRPDVMAMMESAAQRVARQLDASDPRQARLAREVLESEPGLDIDGFEQRVAKLVERRDEPLGAGFYHQASPDDFGIEQSLKNAGWTTTRMSSGSTEVGIVVRDPDGRVGSVWRAFDPATGTFSMRHAFREYPWEGAVPGAIRGMIKSGLPQPLTPKGTPALQFFTLQAMNALQIPYGRAGGIRLVRMESILNARTIAQINWFKRTYYPNQPWSAIPPDDLSRALLLTQSGRYGAEAVAFAGYRVKSARFDLSGMTGQLETTTPRTYTKYFEPDGEETFEAFLSRHGLDNDTPVFGRFDILLEVEPW